VCCRKGDFTIFVDNVEATCALCGYPIFHRPSVPKRPPKICVSCALLIGQTEDQPRQ